ncbi:hypothetical protein DPEC_G00216900, partial [Dallia pectoralis]
MNCAIHPNSLYRQTALEKENSRHRKGDRQEDTPMLEQCFLTGLRLVGWNRFGPNLFKPHPKSFMFSPNIAQYGAFKLLNHTSHLYAGHGGLEMNCPQNFAEHSISLLDSSPQGVISWKEISSWQPAACVGEWS